MQSLREAFKMDLMHFAYLGYAAMTESRWIDVVNS